MQRTERLWRDGAALYEREEHGSGGGLCGQDHLQIPRMAKQTTTCSVDGCDAPTRSRGWCRAHYSRWYRWGDPLIVKAVPSDPATAAERRREKSRRDARSYRSRRNGKSWQSPDGLCNKCKEHPHTATSGYCRSCLATAKRELRQRPGQREKIATWQRAAHLRHAYSLTVEEYDASARLTGRCLRHVRQTASEESSCRRPRP